MDCDENWYRYTSTDSSVRDGLIHLNLKNRLIEQYQRQLRITPEIRRIPRQNAARRVNPSGPVAPLQQFLVARLKSRARGLMRFINHPRIFPVSPCIPCAQSGESEARRQRWGWGWRRRKGRGFSPPGERQLIFPRRPRSHYYLSFLYGDAPSIFHVPSIPVCEQRKIRVCRGSHNKWK